MTRRQPQVRWLLTEDLAALVSLELDVAPDPWSAATYREFLQARNQIAQVALVNDELLGALACRLERGDALHRALAHCARQALESNVQRTPRRDSQ
jgi:hypothetical protein